MTLLDPRSLAALGDLSLVARLVVDGFMFGVHPSRLQGAGLEFSQYRSYQPGDDLRRLDWRLFARSDRYFVRESEAETSVTVRLVLDASDSMRHEEDGVSKFAYGRMLAAALALLAWRQGDAVALVAPGDGAATGGRADRGRQHYHRVLRQLEALEPGGAWPPWERMEGVLLGGAGRGITIVISDLHERGDEIRGVIRRLAALRHDVRVVHLLGRAELEFGYAGSVAFEELETGRTVEVDADAARDAYLASFGRELRTVDLELGELRAGHVRVLIDQPLDETLGAVLGARRG